MAKSGSASQVSQNAGNNRGGGSASPGPRTTAPSAAGMRRRPQASSRPAGPSNSNMFRFYSDDAPGLKVSPIVVLVMALCFIGVVTMLHIFGKIVG